MRIDINDVERTTPWYTIVFQSNQINCWKSCENIQGKVIQFSLNRGQSRSLEMRGGVRCL